MSYVPLYTPPAERTEPALWFLFQKQRMIVTIEAERHALPCCFGLEEHGMQPLRHQYLGTYHGRHCYAAEVGEDVPLPAGWSVTGLREVFGHFEETLAALSGRAYQLIDWDRNHQYCSRCGSPTQFRADERSKTCPACGYTTYPPVSPAIMILITRGDELLLARKSSFAPGRYSALAGFVEPGETLEATVAREAYEEVGVQVKNIRYFGSQPWPFPHSLMVAFTGEYAGGELRPDGVEIEEARWFRYDELPHLPPSISISRKLIVAVAAELAHQHSSHG
ncbi:MAG: NAD(+) diphosphatase [Rhodospirillaceae bacterium]